MTVFTKFVLVNIFLHIFSFCNHFFNFVALSLWRNVSPNGIKNLFFYKGLSLSDYQHQFFSEVLSDFPLLGDFIKQDYCHQQDNRILLTVQGLALSDQLGPQFISPEVHSLETHKR